MVVANFWNIDIDQPFWSESYNCVALHKDGDDTTNGDINNIFFNENITILLIDINILDFIDET